LNRLRRALAIALVVGAGAAAGFIAYRWQSPSGPRATPAAAAAPPSAPDSEDVRPTRPIPARLPDLTLPDLQGTPTPLSAFGGRPLIVNFWATWCAPCRHEIPLLRELRRRHRAEHLEVVGIALDFATAVRQYLKTMPIDYPLLIGEDGGASAAEQFGVETVLPFSVFADSHGGLVALKIGELHPEEAEFILSEIGRLDRGEVGMKEAQAAIEGRLRELAVKRATAQQNSP
jgi:thiol-disulfide isomerase/thioredoxin